jgi:transcriptional regulator with XRE-family HTH domain
MIKLPRVRSAETAERDARAAELRKKNLSYRQIAEKIGFASSRSAYEAVRRGNLDAFRETVEDARRLALERLDEMSQVARDALDADHFVVTTTGRIVEHPLTGEPLRDYGPVLAALDRLQRFEVDRRKIMGIDAPVKTITMDAIDVEIDNINAEAAELDRLEAVEAAGIEEPKARGRAAPRRTRSAPSGSGVDVRDTRTSGKGNRSDNNTNPRP